MLMTDDVAYDDAEWPTRMRGNAAVRGFVESTRTVPDLSLGRVVYDTADNHAPVGILPRPRSLGDRAIIALANLQAQLRRR